MTGPDLILNPDQAGDLRELLNLSAVLHHWLQSASDRIPGDLASFAYLATFHPRSYAHWLSEDLVSLSGRLQTATNSSRCALDTSASIGKQVGNLHAREPGDPTSCPAG